MRFLKPLIEARLVRRYQRFLVDLLLEDGSTLTAHTPNTGSLLGCCTPGSRTWLQECDNGKRKYRHTWELVEAMPGVLVGINTLYANRLAAEAIERGIIKELSGYEHIRREVPYGRERSRIDLLLEGAGGRCFVEVKNVTAVDGRGRAIFPDAVTARGAKHLRELMAVVEEGERATLLFCVQREDANAFRPADEIDPTYGKLLREAAHAGVELLAYRARIDPLGIDLATPLPVHLDY